MDYSSAVDRPIPLGYLLLEPLQFLLRIGKDINSNGKPVRQIFRDSVSTSLSEKSSSPESDPCTGKVHHCKLVFHLLFPTDEYPSDNHPSARAIARNLPLLSYLLATSFDVSCVFSFIHQLSCVYVVVCLVQTDVLWFFLCRLRPLNRYRLQPFLKSVMHRTSRSKTPW